MRKVIITDEYTGKKFKFKANAYDDIADMIFDITGDQSMSERYADWCDGARPGKMAKLTDRRRHTVGWVEIVR